MMPKSEDNRYKIRIEMGWGNNEQELFPWKGRIRVSDGQILEAEPCFRGRSVLAPSASQDVSQDNINEIDNRILSISDDSVSWQCFTVKNPSPVQPQTCAVIAEIQGSRDTVVEIEVNGHCRRTSIGELCRYGYSEHMKPYHSQAYKVHTAVSCSQYTAENSFTDEWEGTCILSYGSGSNQSAVGICKPHIFRIIVCTKNAAEAIKPAAAFYC